MTKINNSNVSFSSVEEKNKKNGKATAAALAAGVGVTTAATFASRGLVAVIPNALNATLDENNLIKSKLDEVLTKTGLDSKGVKIKYIPENLQILDFRDEFSKKIMPSPLEQVRQGKNAFFNPKTGEILLPESKMAGAGFHEIGHAMNKHFSKYGKILQKCRPLMVLVAVPNLIGVFSKNKKAEDGKELSTGAKITNFIRNNAGKLSLACMAPTLIEEAMASAKGQKLAKGLLSPEMFKKVAKGNKIGFLTYAVQAAGVALASWTAVKVKDRLVAKKELKNNV